MRPKPLKSKQEIKEIENLHSINKSDDDWLDRVYRKSESDSRVIASISLKSLDN